MESSLLRAKLLGDWESLEFMRDFWNPEYDERDILQYRRLAPVWRMRESGASFKQIANQLGEDTGKCCALVSGKNCRPYLAQMYLNREVLGKPRNGWKWILERTPKPTAPYPKVVEVPEKITGYHDITDFLAQFPPVPKEHPTLDPARERGQGLLHNEVGVPPVEDVPNRDLPFAIQHDPHTYHQPAESAEVGVLPLEGPLHRVFAKSIDVESVQASNALV